jgi:hypothetical protein
VVLLNRQIVAAGPPASVLTADRLRETFGGAVIVLPESQRETVLA